MKEHPILFSTPMVKAILAGEKTQTRRIVTKGRSGPCETAHKSWLDWNHNLMYPNNPLGVKLLSKIDSTVHRVLPPYEVGDHLWVRETFYSYGFWIQEDNGKHRFIHHQDPVFKYMDNPPVEVLIKSGKDDGLAFYRRPSIFMPREASRITLEITYIRVERLHDISEKDAKAEGVESIKNPILTEPYKYSFGLLWVEINGTESWKENPFVWVVKFRRVES